MPKYFDLIKSLENKNVTIGIQGFKGEQKKLVRKIPAYAKLPKSKLNKNNPKRSRHAIDPDLTVAQVAGYNEFGSEDPPGRPPSRPFLRMTLSKNRKQIFEEAKKALRTPETFFERIGEWFRKMVVKTINSGELLPNAKSTIKFKGSSKPLVDTGQLKNAITYKVNSNDQPG